MALEGAATGQECLFHFHALQRRFQVVDVMLKFGEAGVFHRGDADRFLLVTLDQVRSFPPSSSA